MSQRLRYGPRFRTNKVIEGPTLEHLIGPKNQFNMFSRYRKYIAELKRNGDPTISFKQFKEMVWKPEFSKEKKREIQIKMTVRHSNAARAKTMNITLPGLDKSTTNTQVDDMDQPTERALWNRLRSKFEEHGEKAYRIEAANTPGFPDVVWVNRNGVVLIELKAGRFVVRVAQKKLVYDLNGLGIDVWIVWQKEARGEVTVWRAHKLIDDPVGAIGTKIDDWLTEQRKDTI